MKKSKLVFSVLAVSGLMSVGLSSPSYDSCPTDQPEGKLMLGNFSDTTLIVTAHDASINDPFAIIPTDEQPVLTVTGGGHSTGLLDVYNQSTQTLIAEVGYQFSGICGRVLSYDSAVPGVTSALSANVQYDPNNPDYAMIVGSSVPSVKAAK